MIIHEKKINIYGSLDFGSTQTKYLENNSASPAFAFGTGDFDCLGSFGVAELSRGIAANFIDCGSTYVLVRPDSATRSPAAKTV
jgi:hypothetical protein